MSDEDRVNGDNGEPEGNVEPQGDGEQQGNGAPQPNGEPEGSGEPQGNGEQGGGEAPPAEGKPPAAQPPQRREEPKADEAVPGADLEPDLVLDEPPEEERYSDAERYPDASADDAGAEDAPEEAPPPPTEPSAARSPMELAADARYSATGKRKTSVARVTLKPGDGTYTVNGRSLEQFFPRPTLQKTARQPLATAGYDSRLDVVAKLHGGGVSSQAGALRHGVARALVEADPNLRGELKRRGFLTRDPRVKERKKAGLKKARKRPQFSKR